MIHQSEYNLFNASDNALMPYLKQEDFEKSLLFNVLFQDKLLVPESSFFTSFFLANHIKNARSAISLFETAAKEGIVIPAYRNENIQTLRESYESMLPVYGKDYVLTNEAHDIDCLFRMCSSVDLGRKKQEAFIWPKNIILGEGYYHTLKSFLQREDLPPYIRENEMRYVVLKKYWDQTKAWRYDLIEKAAVNTLNKGGKGLQRTELIKLIAKEKGIPDQVALDAKNPISHFLPDQKDRKLVDVFLKWITQCHHLNMARAFDSSLNFPVYNNNEDFMCESIARVPRDKSITKHEGFECEVQLPPINVLLTENPASLIDIRNDLGYGYLIALKDWQESPTDKNMENVRILFREYCKRICERYAGGRTVVVKSHYSSAKEVKKESFDFINNIISSILPVVGIFTAFGKLGYAFYEYHSERRRSKITGTRLEINLKESSKEYSSIL